MDNLPQVPPEKQEKLAAVIKRLYAHIGTIREGLLCTRCSLLSAVPEAVLATPIQNSVFRSFVHNVGGFWMPSDEETKLTKGFAFIEFLTPEVSRTLHYRFTTLVSHISSFRTC